MDSMGDGSKLWITSLNSHFRHQKPQYKMLWRKKAELKTPHFLNSNQDIVVGSQEEKCGLKYVMHIPGAFWPVARGICAEPNSSEQIPTMFKQV